MRVFCLSGSADHSSDNRPALLWVRNAAAGVYRSAQAALFGLFILLATVAPTFAQSLSCSTTGASTTGTVIGTNGVGDNTDTISITNLASGRQVSIALVSNGNQDADMTLTNPTGSGTFSATSFNIAAFGNPGANRSETYTAANSGAHSITVAIANTGNTAGRNISWTATCTAAPPIITTTSPLIAGIVGTTYNFALAATGGTTTYNWALSGGTMPGGLALSAAGVITGTPTTAGTSAFSVTATSSGGGTSSPVTFSLTINKADQAIAFTNPGTKTFGDAPFGLTATSTSGLTVAFASTTATVCTISGSTVTILAAGSCSITASQPGNANYNTAPDVTQTFNIMAGINTITFPAPANTPFTSAPPTLTATASSGLAISYASNSAPICTVTTAGVITFVTAGTCSLTASQAGNTNYAAATPVTQTFNITAGVATIQLSTSATAVLLGQPAVFSVVVAPVLATGTVSFNEGAAGLCSNVALSGGTASCNASFATGGAHTITARYNGSANYAAVTSAVVTVTVNDQRARTVEAIGRFLGARNNQILTNQPDASRQIDRLIEAGGGDAGNGAPGAGLADKKSGGLALGRDETGPSSRLAGPASSDLLRLRYGGRDRQFGSATSTDTNPFPVQDSSIGGVGVSGYRALNSDLPGTVVNGIDQGSSGGSVQAGGLRLQGQFESAMGLGFATSLRDVTRAAEDAAERKASEAGYSLSGSRGGPGRGAPAPFDLWLEAKYTSFHNDKTVADLDGHFGMVTIGTDYVLNSRILVGTMVQFDSMQQRSNSQLMDVSGKGWMAGPYMTLRLSENVFLQARGAWGRSDNTLSPFLTFTDKFETERWLVSSTLTGRWNNGPWSFRPSATIAYMEDDAKGYLDAFGAAIPEVKSSLGQAKAGPELRYRIDLGHTVIEPHAGIQAIWNFDHNVSAAGFGQIGPDAAGPEGVRGRAELGVRAVTSGGLRVDFSGSYDGIGADNYNAITGRGVVHVPF